MQLDRPLAVITPTVDGDVLAALAYRRDVGSTPGQIQYLLGRRTTQGIRRSLARLVDQGIVRYQPSSGNGFEYRLNRRHLAAPAILALAAARTRLVARIAASLTRWSVPPVYAALYGPAVQGAMSPQDGIDLFVAHAGGGPTGPVDEDAEELATSLRAWTGNPVRIVVMAEDEAPGRTTEPLLIGLRHDCLRVLGSPSWVEHQFRLARDMVAPATPAT